MLRQRVNRQMLKQPYVCPTCQIRRLSKRLYTNRVSDNDSSAIDLKRSGRDASRQRGAQYNRLFSNTASHRQQSEIRQDARQVADPVYSPSASRSVTPSSSSTESRIRQHLRDWSKTMSQQKKEQGLNALVQGRGVVLQNSLFLNEPMREEEEDDEEGPSEELQEYDEMFHEDPESTLEPGSLIHMPSTPTSRGLYVVFIGYAGIQGQYILSNGRWMVSPPGPKPIHFIKGWLSSQELEAIREHLPTTEVVNKHSESGQIMPAMVRGDLPQEVFAPLLPRFARLNEEADQFYRTHVRKLDNLYELVKDERHWNVMSFNELCKVALDTDFDTLTDGGRLLLVEKIMSVADILYFVIEHEARFIVTPQYLVTDAETVHRWARSYQDAAARSASGIDVAKELRENPLSSFIDKARRLILKSRQIRSPTSIGGIGPSSTRESSNGQIDRRPTGEEFSENDKKILEFLWVLYVKRPAAQGPSRRKSGAVGSIILRAIGAYPKMALDTCSGTMLLRELGCLDPWTCTIDHTLWLPTNWNRVNKRINQLREAEARAVTDLGLTDDTSRIPFTDTMSHLRKDWGDLEVLCVDDVDTHLVDDGISIEKADGHPGCYWLHCHIAHPSAFIPVNHPFVEMARAKGSGFYGPTRTEWYMHGQLLQLLGVRPHGPVLTFSTLLSMDGTVHDVQVVPGVVHNVVRIDKAAFAEVFNPKVERVSLTVGKFPKAPRARAESKAVPEEAMDKIRQRLDQFKLIHRLLQARWAARRKEVPAVYNPYLNNRYKPGVHASMLNDDVSFDRIFHSQHCYNDPAIRLEATKFPSAADNQQMVVRDDIITGSMVLACETAGRWLRERRIPACFLGHTFSPDFPISKLNQAKPADLVTLPKSKRSATAIPNALLTTKQYSRVTSPLRRFEDLIAHYQIDAYLKRVATGDGVAGQPLEDDSVLPFGLQAVEDFLKEGNPGRDLSLHSKREELWWIFMGLFRAFHFKEAKLPEIWNVEVGSILKGIVAGTGWQNARGMLAPFGCRAAFIDTKEGWELQARTGQHLPCKLELVDPEKRVVHVRAIGPPSDTATVVNTFDSD